MQESFVQIQGPVEMKLWLDDIRPAPVGWTWVKTADEAREKLQTQIVTHASLDHDLGACETCMGGRTAEQWLEEHNCMQMPNCEHFGTGYTLVCWMEQNDIWPTEFCTIHSRNPAGRMRMAQVISKKFNYFGQRRPY
jgi:hypothetical protein